MPVRDHHSDHERPGDMRLVTESATVTRFDPLDHGRNDEVEHAVVDLLADHGEDRWHRRARDGDVRVDWQGLRDALADGEVPAGCAGDLQVLRERHQRPYPSLAAVGLAVDGGFDHLPGQYLALRYASTPRAYSVASPPSADEVELCMRRVPGGELTSDLFENIAVGDEVTVRGPCGHFVPERPSRRDVAFLATGTGIAPLRSMLEHLLERGLDVHDGVTRDLWVFLGTSWRDDLAYRDRFRELHREHDNVHFVPTCTREHLLSDWDGEDDYVQRVLVKYLADDVDTGGLPDSLSPYVEEAPATDVDARLDPENLEVYACGINAMVYRLEEAVRSLGVPAGNVHGEGYG